LWRIDAGKIVLIIDSCHSGASVGKAFRPAPLGDDTLGQVAYDKRMQILVGTQPGTLAPVPLGEPTELGQALIRGLQSYPTQSSQPGIDIGQWLNRASTAITKHPIGGTAPEGLLQTETLLYDYSH
jgi:hypothetical protein